MNQNQYRNPWTDEEVEKVRLLAAQGLSASMIGERIGRPRNSVIGICHRRSIQLGSPSLHRGGRATRKRPPVERRGGPKPLPATSMPVPEVPAEKTRSNRQGLATAHLRETVVRFPAPKGTCDAVAALEAHQCKYIYGDPLHDEDARFCEREQKELPDGKRASYCEEHYAACYYTVAQHKANQEKARRARAGKQNKWTIG